jgi:hypothetical protein
MSQRETELDTVARLIWLERQKNLDAIERGVAAALPRRDSQVWRTQPGWWVKRAPGCAL